MTYESKRKTSTKNTFLLSLTRFCHRRNNNGWIREGFVCNKIEVVDTSIGMSKEFLPSLFEAFECE